MDDGIVLIGEGTHCSAVIDILSLLKWKIYGLTAQDPYLPTTFNLKNLEGADKLPEVRKHASKALICLVHYRKSSIRESLFAMAKSLDFDMVTVVSPLAHVEDGAVLGKGSTIMHHTILNRGVTIGDNVILATKACVETGGEIGSHCYISPGVTIGHRARIGSGTYIGMGAVIHDEVHIGDNCYIEPGWHVKDHMESGSTCETW